MAVRIGAGQGTAGDSPAGIGQLLDAGVDYLCLESLAELVMGRLAAARRRDPGRGYAADLPQYLRPALPAIAEGRVKLISNAGGLNPPAAAARAAQVAGELGLEGLRIGIVYGDDLGDALGELRAAGAGLRNLDTGAGFEELPGEPEFASCYLGAGPVVQALRQGADIVLAGRVTDATLFLAPLIHEYGWAADDWDRLAAGVLLGHLLECSGQVAGGNYSGRDWDSTPRPWDVPFPFADVEADGTATLGKPAACGGRVSFDSVRHQLLYEVGDPSRYLNPDVVADFGSARVEDRGDDRVRVSGVRGAPAPDSYKLLIGHPAGWGGEIRVGLAFPHALEKAKVFAALFKQRVKRAGHAVDEWCVEFQGWNALGGPTVPAPGSSPPEIVLRVAWRCPDAATSLAIREELTSLYLSGPAAGVAVIHSLMGGGREPQALQALWPALVDKRLVDPRVRVAVGEVRAGGWEDVETRPYAAGAT